MYLGSFERKPIIPLDSNVQLSKFYSMWSGEDIHFSSVHPTLRRSKLIFTVDLYRNYRSNVTRGGRGREHKQSRRSIRPAQGAEQPEGGGMAREPGQYNEHGRRVASGSSGKAGGKRRGSGREAAGQRGGAVGIGAWAAGIGAWAAGQQAGKGESTPSTGSGWRVGAAGVGAWASGGGAVGGSVGRRSGAADRGGGRRAPSGGSGCRGVDSGQWGGSVGRRTGRRGSGRGLSEYASSAINKMVAHTTMQGIKAGHEWNRRAATGQLQADSKQ
ncbi:hypothetical protein B0H11DRAFT_1932923 [Mycena galericulata]|nr:hypothetical protein B0H11DRAFT_1932923 [Mycena galericulata]